MVHRDKAGGIAWVEQLLGGKVIDEYAQERWRPQYFLTVRTPGGGERKVVLRGFRTPGYASPDEATSRFMLGTDAQMLEALQPLPMKVPRYYGHHEQLGWMLMEWVDGHSEITDLEDGPLKSSIFREYMRDIATLHSQEQSTLKIPANLKVPGGIREVVDDNMRQVVAMFEQHRRPDPEPIYRLALQWSLDNPLHDRPIRLGLGDVGPNQFLFKDGHYAALFDCEYGTVSDPLMEIGLMRSRSMTYPMPDLAGHIRYYGDVYHSLTGESLDEKAIHFWSIFAQVAYMMHFNQAMQFPSPSVPDSVFVYAFEAQNRRSIPEALADLYRIDLDPPELPESMPNSMTVLHELMQGQQQHYLAHAKTAEERTFAKYSAALSETLARNNDHGPVLHGDTLNDLGELLGYRPHSIRDGMGRLDELIQADYAKDLDRRVRFLHRLTIRQEFLYEPIQRATGVASGYPLSRLNG